MLIKQTTQMTDSERIATENSNNQFLQSLSFVAVGTIYPFAGSTIPDTFMLCDGSALDTTEYSELFSVIGYTYGGSGDSFNIPDLRGKVLVGCDSSDTSFNALGKKGGAKEVTLTVAQMPKHSHGGMQPNGLVTENYGWHMSETAQNYGAVNDAEYEQGASRGGDQPHENMPPYMVCNYIIKVNQGISTDDFRLPIDQTYTPTSPNAQSGLATAEAVGVANDYTDKAIKSLKTYANNTFAPAIKNTVSGGVLAVHDVSPVEHALGVNVRSKNILPYPYASGSSYTTNGVTFTANDDGSVTLNGTPTITAVYYMSVKRQDTKITTEGNVYALSLRGSPDINNIYIANNMYGGEHTGERYSSQGKTYCIFTDKGATGVDCYIVVLVGAGTLENVTVYPQLELGSTATEYTPYVADLSAVGVSRLGKNLIPSFIHKYNYSLDYKEFNSENAISLQKGIYMISGTEKPILQFFDISTKEQLLVSDVAEKGSSSYSVVWDGYALMPASQTVNDTTITILKPVIVTMAGQYTEITDCQLELGTTATDYEPYIEPQTVTANADGTVEGLTSLSPNITVTTDTEGVVIDMTYNADTKMYIDNKLAEISTAIVNNV